VETARAVASLDLVGHVDVGELAKSVGGAAIVVSFIKIEVVPIDVLCFSVFHR